jgi:hypothetical protein
MWKANNYEEISIQKSFVVPTTDGKLIEHHGLAATANPAISIAHMIAPPMERT